MGRESSKDFSECSCPLVAQLFFGASLIMTVTASRGMPYSASTLVIPSTTFFCFLRSYKSKQKLNHKQLNYLNRIEVSPLIMENFVSSLDKKRARSKISHSTYLSRPSVRPSKASSNRNWAFHSQKPISTKSKTNFQNYSSKIWSSRKTLKSKSKATQLPWK